RVERRVGGKHLVLIRHAPTSITWLQCRDGSKHARGVAPGARLSAGCRYRASAAEARIRRAGGAFGRTAETDAGRRSVLATARHARVPALAAAHGARLRAGSRARAQAPPAAASGDELLGGARPARDGPFLGLVRRGGSELGAGQARSAPAGARRVHRGGGAGGKGR